MTVKVIYELGMSVGRIPAVMDQVWLQVVVQVAFSIVGGSITINK